MAQEKKAETGNDGWGIENASCEQYCEDSVRKKGVLQIFITIKARKTCERVNRHCGCASHPNAHTVPVAGKPTRDWIRNACRYPRSTPLK